MLAQAGVFEFADVRVDTRAYRFARGGREIALEPKAFAVLLEFIAHAGEMLSRDALLDAVWRHRYVTPATLSRIIVLLRRALGDDPEAPHFIETVHGKGYRFVVPEIGQPESGIVPTPRFAPPQHAQLPARMTEIIGRDREIAEAGDALDNARLLNIVGAGGMGKTTVALEVARAGKPKFADGVWFFDLSNALDGDSAMDAIASAFGEHGPAEAGTEQRLAARLLARSVLLLLDNCERIAHELGAFIARLLAACGDVRVLVTSQRRLGCLGEHVYLLRPLAIPRPQAWNNAQALAELSSVASIRFLIARTRAFAAPLELTTSNADGIAELCRRLDGMPLALEFAAARLRVLDPAQLLARLDERFHWPAGTGRPERHRTLGMLMARSFALLDEPKRRLLSALSEFANGCTLDSAIDIAAALAIDAALAVDLLTALTDNSMLIVDADFGPPRYRLPDSVRLYARARLAEGADELVARSAPLDARTGLHDPPVELSRHHRLRRRRVPDGSRTRLA